MTARGVLVTTVLAVVVWNVSLDSNVSDVPRDRRDAWHTAVTDHLTGSYRLTRNRSDEARTTADRPTGDRRSGRHHLRSASVRSVEAPEWLSIERDEQTITVASPQVGPMTFEADGREQVVRSRNGWNLRTTATLSGNRLVISTGWDQSVAYQLALEPMSNGRRLRVTRHIRHGEFGQVIVANSVYDRTSNAPLLIPGAGNVGNAEGATGALVRFTR